MRGLLFFCVQPDDFYYTYQVQLWLESLRELKLSDKAVCLIYTPSRREFNVQWKDVERLYPEAKFAYFKDDGYITKLLSIYIPIIRPYCLMEYFKQHPELEEKAVFYCDCDILFTKNFNINSYIDDNVCYLSNTLSYINASYFDSKVKDVLPEKLEEYKERDILDESCRIVGISREIAEKWNDHSGGAQYLLKGINYKFWEKVLTDCIKIRLHLTSVNKEFFGSENKGFQSWCSDMFSLLWNLWYRKKETKIVPEMDFAWSTDPVSKLEKVGIMHNAGITGDYMGEIPVFFKGKYHRGSSPFKDPHLDKVYNNEKSKTLANWYYVSKLIDLKNKYNLN